MQGWESYYEVSEDGRVCNHTRDLKQRRNADGYLMVQLSQPRFSHLVHRLVAAAFVPNPSGKPNVNHIDNDWANNDWKNLEWCTQRENLEHMTRQGRRSKHNLGVQPVQASLSDERVKQCLTLREQGFPYSRIAEIVGTNKKSAMLICQHRSYGSALKRIGVGA